MKKVISGMLVSALFCSAIFYGTNTQAQADKTNAKRTRLASIASEDAGSLHKEDEEVIAPEDELIVTLDSNVEEGEIKEIMENVSQDYEVLAGSFEINENLPEKKKERLRNYLAKKEYNTIISVNIKEDEDIEEVKEELESVDEIENVEYNYEVEKTQGMPTGMKDPFISNQYYLNTIDAATAWDAFDYGEYSEVWVAVIDTGLCIKNPDFSGVYLKNYSVDVTTSDTGKYTKLVNMSTPYLSEHGTLVAGVLAAKGNKTSIVGVANGYCGDICKLMAINAAHNKTHLWESDQIKAIQYSIENGAEVINMSFGYPGSESFPMRDVIQNAYNAGITIVAAMGNDKSTEKNYPADYNHVISVSATTKTNKLADFSNYGHEDICAPGEGIYTTGINSNSWTVSSSGTSLATPIVSATAALVKSINYNLTPSQIENILYKTAKNIGSSSKFGNGLVNTGYAVQMAKYKGLRTITSKIKSVTETSAKNVKIKWKDMEYAEGYAIYRATSKNGTYKRIGVVDASEDEKFTDKTVSSGKTYYYKMRAYTRYQAGSGTVNGKPVGYSTYSDIVSIKVK